MYVTPMILLHSGAVLKESCKAELIIFHALDGTSECLATQKFKAAIISQLIACPLFMLWNPSYNKDNCLITRLLIK